MLNVYTIENAEQWDSVVRSFARYDVYYLSGYAQGLRAHGDGEPLLFYCQTGSLRGINVVMKRAIANDPRFAEKLADELYDFVSPYGYGGWLLEGEGDVSLLVEEYDRWCRKNHIVSEFVRFHPLLKNHEAVAGVYDTVCLGSTVAMDLASRQTVWEDMTSKNRNMVRKAQKNGLRVYRASGPEMYRVFKEIYDLTMDKDHADSYYYFGDAYYESIREDLAHNAQIFYAQTEDGTVAAAAIMLGANGRLNYHLSGSRQELQRLAPTNLLLYEAACWGCENGYQTFHLGGGIGAKEDSLYSFKKAFCRKESHPFYIGKRIIDPEAYRMLVALREEPVETSFFPAYRAQ